MYFKNPNLNDLSRQKFIAVWNNEYSEPLGLGIIGMIVFSNECVWVERNGEKVNELEFDERSVFKNTKPKTLLSQFIPTEVLNSGDWIECSSRELQKQNNKQNGIAKVDQIRLLSPNRMNDGHRSEVKIAIREWNRFVNKVNSFFQSQGFDFLNTPTLVTCPGTEPSLDAFYTEFVFGSKSRKMFLPTSPELHLKKCLAKGWDKIYEIRSCFRNGEISPIHQPEFYLLEWYRAFSTTENIRKDLRDLIQSIAPEFESKTWANMSVADLFFKYLNFELQPSTSMEDLIGLAKRNEIDVSKALDFDEVFYFIFLEKIEPRLQEYECLYVHNYPPSQAALAKLTPCGWGDRFELYINGIEIANAFCELNNPIEQRNRAQEDLKKKEIYRKMPIYLDEDFFSHLDRGMPPASGIALGLERLFMVLKGYTSIEEFRLFPMSCE